MQHFTSADDVSDPQGLVNKALEIKKAPQAEKQFGANKTLGMLFFNASLRTRMSTQIAAQNLGMQVIVMNVSQDSWQLEMEDGTVMDGGKAEHVREAAAVMGAYCEVLGIRSFPELKDRETDYRETVINAFVKHARVPVISLESATLHPLQSLADWMTIEEFKQKPRPKVVLTWAPHVRALPQAVPNSFAQWMGRSDFEVVITHPEGMELEEQFTQGATIEYDQKKALEGADFVYVKNWSSFKDYGKIHEDRSWLVDSQKLRSAPDAKVMHCLPVRRNVVIADEVLDGPQSIVIQQATNRIYSAQAVIREVLKNT